MDKYGKIVKVNILQWNAQSIKPKLVALENILLQETIHIAALCETWLEPDSHLKVNDYNIYRNDRSDSYGGVALFVHKSIKASLYQIQAVNPAIEVICIKVHNCDKIKFIVSLYCPPSARTSQLDWEQLFSLFSNNSIVLGDYNGHHSNWSNKTDQRGTQIFDTLVDKMFITLNDGSPTRISTFNGTLRQSSPDISIVSSDLALQFYWRTLNETLGSDHIMIKMSTNINSQPILNTRRNLKKADWSSYRDLLSTLFDGFRVSNDLQKSYDSFIEALNIAADLHIPFIKINPNPNNKFNPKPYWSSNLSKSVAERRLALSIFRRNPTPRNLNILNHKIRESQNVIRQAKSESWQKFCSSINNNTPPSEMWHKMRWFKGHKLFRNHVEENICVRLLSNLAPDFVSPVEPVFTSNNSNLEIPITLNEFLCCIRHKDTSPGCDNISYSMIDKLPDNAKDALVTLYNRFLQESFVPYQWKQISIIPIPKPGRDPQSTSSLRPISMISCVCKIFHCILIKRLEWYIEKKSLLSPLTTGFRKCRSTLDNLSTLVARIQTGFSERLITIGCFVDVEDAYNNVDITYLLKLMDSLGVGVKLCLYLWNFLKERFLTINLDTKTICRKTGRGLAQGDPFSPILFNLATINICKEISKIAHITQYADDFVLFVTCNSLERGTVILQSALDTFSQILFDIGLEISPTKSKTIVFRSGVRRDTVSLKYKSITLESVDNIKYLGLWLDHSLRWAKHINELKCKISKLMNIFKVLVGPGWGMHPKHLRRLYISLIRSRLDYASFLYNSSCKIHLIKLDKLQNQCMRIIGGFIKSTPIHVMECELYIQPLHVRRYFLAGKFWLKAASLRNSEIITILVRLSDLCETFYWRRKSKPLLVVVHNSFVSIPIHKSNNMEMYSLNTWLSYVDLSKVAICSIEDINKSKKSYNSSVIKSMCNNFLENKYYDYYKIYTDGCKTKDECGLAIYDPQMGCSIQLRVNVRMSIMYVELIAIAEALSYVESLGPGRYVILTDSKSSLQHLLRCTSNFRGAPIAYVIIDSILNCSKDNKMIRLQWIPSHVGLLGNEEVDRLASQAATEGLHFDCLPYYTDLIYECKKKCTALWKEHFDERSLTKGIWYKTIQPSLTRSPWFVRTDWNRSDVVLALRLRSGHIPLNSFAYLMKKTITPNCSECDVIENVYHILVECVRNEAERRSFCALFDICLNEVGRCNSILAKPDSKVAKKLIKFVKVGIRRRI